MDLRSIRLASVVLSPKAFRGEPMAVSLITGEFRDSSGAVISKVGVFQGARKGTLEAWVRYPEDAQPMILHSLGLGKFRFLSLSTRPIVRRRADIMLYAFSEKLEAETYPDLPEDLAEFIAAAKATHEKRTI